MFAAGSPLRVLVVHNRYRSDSPSGENDVVDAEVAALTARGHRVLLYDRSSDEIDHFPLSRKALLPVRALYSRVDVEGVRRAVSEFAPDVVHVHNLNPLLSPAVIPAVLKTTTPVVMTVHNFRLVCSAGTHFRDGHECFDCTPRSLRGPAVQHACYRGSRIQSTVMAATLTAHRRSYLSVDRFIALSPTVRDFLGNYGVPAERIVVKPNTVDDPGPPAPLPAGARFLFAGRLTPEKGVVELAQAWARSGDGSLGELTILGDGPSRSEVEQLVQGRRDAVVRGRVSAAEVAAQMRQHTVLVVPSRWAEAFPRVAAEALAHGRPVLTTDRGSLPEIVGDAGWVVPATADGLAAGLACAATDDIAEKSRQARRRYETTYHPDVVHSQLVATYRDVVDGRDSRP